MKTLISIILVMVLELILTGCDREPEIRDNIGNYETCEYIGTYMITGSGYYMCDDERLSVSEYRQLKLVDNAFYSKDEIDELEQRIEALEEW